ncbi:hypothetical protein [Pseudomonas sp. PNP]|uniref:DUF7168 domain-containing protein n=1 Tax=Pseudomonas sp. PNP TaxID=361819 RepID=UPI001AECF37C|nr:hypothetical protein [Pseudomonas sp. PNP]MBP2843825.1 hypothetical protein [Pseudomonas sp. PNP]
MSKVSTLIVTGKKEPRQKMWEAMRLLRPGFTVNDIVRRTAGRSADVSRYIQALTKAGVVKLVETPEGATTSRGKVFALIRDEGADHPRLNKNGERTFEHLATENIWRTLRILGGHLTVQDIAKTASAGGVAGYTMTVLLRQVRQARRDFTLTKLQRCKQATKVRRADVFCEAWVHAVHEQVAAFAGAKLSPAVEQYLAHHYPDLEQQKPRDRNATARRKAGVRAINDAMHGLLAAADVRLNHGMTTAVPLALAQVAS